MPTTEFSMKANLRDKEPIFRQRWTQMQLYQQVLQQNQSHPRFILHDGPPYANGPLHIGHALNKILKDFVVRYKNLTGFYAPFVAGWDTHGLPIENRMLSEMQINHHAISVVELRRRAAQYALSQITLQREQFLKFQLLSDLTGYYKTLDKTYEVKQLQLFKKMCLDGLIYKGLKPVYWSPSSQSALAEAEVEYHPHQSPSVFVSLPIVSADAPVPAGTHLIIWTTTPWTLVANSGVAVHPTFTYVMVKCQKQTYLVGEQLLARLALEFGWTDYHVQAHFSGQELIGLRYQSPLNGLNCPVVGGTHVTLEAGTGLVHIAPLFGEDDYLIGKQNQLEMIMHVQDDGTFNDYLPRYQGLFYEAANPLICTELRERAQLLKMSTIEHAYPHDWRTKKPIIYRGTPQWFVSIDKIRNKILTALERVQFYSEWGHTRLMTMIQNREDWTISRQRAWGVPIIIFYDQHQQPVLEAAVFDHVINLVAQFGSDIWYQKSADELLPPQYQNQGWTKETDIMDVWFDSGTSFMAADVAGHQPPFDLYLEGSDQYRGWFNSSLINAVAYFDQAPYKILLSHGFLVDEQGRKMSKSLGNGVDPMDIINNYGADVLRLWVANSEYSNDISISANIIKQTAEMYRKIRNTIRFLLANLSDYRMRPRRLTGVHLWVNQSLINLKLKVKQAYEDYSFVNVIKNINTFISDLSSFYLSVTKDILYIEKATAPERRMVQYNFFQILDFLLVALAPIMPTTTEEAYDHFAKPRKRPSVHLERFYELDKLADQPQLTNQWTTFFSLRDRVYKEIEKQIQAGTIKRSNEAYVQLETLPDCLQTLDLKRLLMVGKLAVTGQFAVTTFASLKCHRCWNHFEASALRGDLCRKCCTIVQYLRGRSHASKRS